jgi:hypothetical protein
MYIKRGYKQIMKDSNSNINKVKQKANARKMTSAERLKVEDSKPLEPCKECGVSIHSLDNDDGYHFDCRDQ